MNKKVKVRLAPSPTGKLHLGTARTGLFNYLFAKSQGGEFVLRIEDTDINRSQEKYKKNIIKGLKWLGTTWDGQPVLQSRRMKEGIYENHLQQLIDQGLAYPCFCSKEELKKERERQLSRGIPPKYSGKCKQLSDKEKEKLKAEGKKPAYRLNVKKLVEKKELPSKLEFNDLIRGKISQEIGIIGDFIIVKQDKTPLYHFAVVIDDEKMNITHVIRGEDHITNTFNQVLLYRAFGFSPPQFAHLPLILDKDKAKLSKRKGNVVSIDEFKKLGYLPEAMVNYLSLLGWGIKDKQEEVFSLKEAKEKFKIEDVNSSPAIFEEKKLNYLNGYYIRKKDNKELLKLLEKNSQVDTKKADKKYLLKIVSLLKDRLKKLSDFNDLAAYFFHLSEYKGKLLIFDKSDQERTIKGIQVAIEAISEAQEKQFSKPEKINKLLSQSVKEADLDNGDLFWPVRVALSGKKASPSPSELIWALGKEETLKRLSTALEKISV